MKEDCIIVSFCEGEDGTGWYVDHISFGGIEPKQKKLSFSFSKSTAVDKARRLAKHFDVDVKVYT